MKSPPAVNTNGSLFRKNVWLALLAVTAGLMALQRSEAAGNIAVWDTVSHLANLADAENRTSWKSVPANLFALEAEPLKAASDPGYYGLEYAFKGMRSWRIGTSRRSSRRQGTRWRSTPKRLRRKMPASAKRSWNSPHC
jgi:hypothetical protein